MTYPQILEGLKNGTITIKDSGHLTNSLIDDMESRVESWEKSAQEYRDIVSGKIKNKEGREADPKRMLELYEGRLSDDVEIGRMLEGEHYCFNCDSTMYFILIDEKTIAYCDSHEYWKISKKSGNTYKYVFQLSDIHECEATHLVKAKKLTANINFPTGEVCFVNHYGEDVKETPEGKEHSRPGLNSILGRNKIMQYLANQNIGYGQMGNMSIGIYSNNKDEIIVGSSSYEDKILDLENYLKGEYGKKPTGKDLQRVKKELKQAKEFDNLITQGKFKLKGEVSLSVWRWMCADVSIQKPIENEYMDKVKLKVKPGTYQINHFYDFPKNGDFLYSTLKKIS